MGEFSTRGAGLGADAGGGTFPPGLTDVDLPTLRAMDDPAVLAAVAGVLADPDGLRRVWYTTDSDNGLLAPRSEHAFSASPAPPPPPGEDTVA
ncbi:hypothetical protein AB0E62_19980 [Streptomyces sp. NPDC038707]|uniref:hypothetical protein n=1 Tax=unclassified Streptomyces TaxID=2593676 RepID=UPI0033C6BC83